MTWACWVLDQVLALRVTRALAVAQSILPNLLAFLKSELAEGMHWVQFWNEPQSQPRPPFCFHPSLSGLLGGAWRDGPHCLQSHLPPGVHGKWWE